MICEDLYFVKEDTINKLRKFGVTYAKMELAFDVFNAMHFRAVFVKEDGSLLPMYQAISDCKTIEEFKKDYGSSDENLYKEPYKLPISLSCTRLLAQQNHLKRDNKELDKEDLEL